MLRILRAIRFSMHLVACPVWPFWEAVIFSKLWRWRIIFRIWKRKRCYPGLPVWSIIICGSIFYRLRYAGTVRQLSEKTTNGGHFRLLQQVGLLRKRVSWNHWEIGLISVKSGRVGVCPVCIFIRIIWHWESWRWIILLTSVIRLLLRCGMTGCIIRTFRGRKHLSMISDLIWIFWIIALEPR